MFELSLTKGFVAFVDDGDWERVSAFRWHASVHSKDLVYAQTRINRKSIRLHRFLMDPPKGMFVDHADGNGLNNVRSNLRICTRSQNVRNSRRRTDSRSLSKYRGVWWFAKCRKWRAALRADGRYVHGGLFFTEEEAARRYDELARIHHGEFARLNFPDTPRQTDCLVCF